MRGPALTATTVTVGLVVAALAGVVFALVKPWWLAGLVGLAAGLPVAALVVAVRASHRRRRFADQLPAALQVVVAGLRAGRPLATAVEEAAGTSANPTGAELAHALAAHRDGADLVDALSAVAHRLASPDLAAVATALRLGAPDSPQQATAFAVAVDLLDERIRLRGHLRTLGADARSASWILGAGAVASGAAVFVLRPEYARPLYTEPAGAAVLALAVLLVAGGCRWLDRLAKLEV